MAEETPTPAPEAPTDRWHLFTEWLRKLFDHERFAVWLPIVVCGAALAIIMVGCKPVATFDGERVTPDTINTVYEGKAGELQQKFAAWVATGKQIELEAESLDKSYDAAFDSMAAQVTERNKWLEAIGGIATAAINGTVNPTSIIGTLLTLGMGATAIGVGVDNRRKNKVIDRLKTTGGTGA
jgi:hypothetical protein